MNLRTVIVERITVFLIKQEHRGQRSDTQLFHVLAKMQLRGDINGRLRPWSNDEPVRTGARRAVKRRIHHNVFLPGIRPLKPERGKDGEFLFAAKPGVDRQTTRRKTIAAVARQCPEIGRPGKGD